jgi:hypothetical protein
MKENGFFSLGAFWVFVISGFFTMVSMCSVYILGYFAVVGYANGPGVHIEAIEASNLLHEMSALSVFLLLSLAWIIFYILFKGSQKAEHWTFWHRFFVHCAGAVGYTVICFYAVYNLALLFVSSVLGANILLDTVTNDASYGWQCANLVTILPLVAAAVIFFWICCLWLCGMGYSLQDEFNWIWGASVKVLKRFLKCIFASINGVGA